MANHSGSGARGESAIVIPVVAEEVYVERLTSEVERVRVRTHVEEQKLLVDAPRAEERVTVERVAVDRFVDGPIPPRQEGATTIVSVVEEVAVVTKRFVLREEIRVTKERVEEAIRAPITLRKQVATVERLSPGNDGPISERTEGENHG